MARASFFLTRTDEESIARRQLKNACFLLVLLFLDAVAAFWLYFTRPRRDLAHELSHLTTAASFKGGTGDLLALVLVRVLLYAGAGSLAISLGKQRNKGPPPPTSVGMSRVGSRVMGGSRATSSTNLAAEPDDLRRALLDPAANDDVSDAPDPASGGVRVGDAPRDASTFDPEQFAPSPEDQLYNSRAATRRNVVVEMTFLCCVAMQAYVAVKSVAFYYAPGRVPRTVALFALTMACVNAESVALRALVASCTVRTGVLRKDFHAHELQFHDRVVGHVCDMCGLRLVAGAKGLRFGGFRCKTCDFDCCMRCFSRKNRDTAEGGIRGDRGTKSELERTPAEYLWRVMALAKLEWPLLTLAIVTTLVTSAAALFVPHFQGAAFDAAISLDRDAFNARAAALLASSVGVSVFSAFKRACFSLVGQRLNYKVRTGLLKNILRQDIAYFDGVNTGDLLSRLSYDCTNLTSPCNTVMSLAAQNFVVILGGLAMCFVVCWRLAMVSFAVVMPITFLIKRYARWSQTLNREISAMLGLASNVANEALGNIRTVRAVSTEDVEFDRYDQHAQAALRAGVKDAFGGALTVALTNLLELGTSVLILWLGGGMTMERPAPRLTVGALITFQLYFNNVTSSYTALTNCLTSLVRAAGSASRVFSLQDNLPDITPGAGASFDPGEGRGPEVVFEGVTFWYQMRPNVLVLDGLSMRVPSGATAALVGKSGGGKTTIVSLLLRYYDVKGGSVALDGTDLRDLDLASVHRRVGLVMQDTQTFNSTIAGNIGYGLSEEEATPEVIERAARLANAHEFIATFPDGYDTRLGERGVRLSGGQKQRLAVARVFLRNPSLLLLDEATSALDLESEHAVQQALDRLVARGGKTAIVVAHRLSTVRHADAIHVVGGGKVVERGTHDELVGREGGAYAALLSLQEKKRKETVGEGE
jgi:ATP-binding cassette subfamily B protein